MEFVKSREDIIENCTTIDKYLINKKEPYYEYALDLVKNGLCFFVMYDNHKDVYKFYPSRFIGYKSNSMESHEKNTDKDGRDTNKVINKVLNKTLVEDDNLENEYKKYCNELGINITNRRRTYWRL